MNDDKKLFIEHYILTKPRKITICFCKNLFLSDNNIRLRYGEKLLKEFLDYYTPWHQKEGRIHGVIQEVLGDPVYRTIKIEDVMKYAGKKSEIEEKSPQLSKQISELCAIPIATDVGVNKTLVLDGNKTLTWLTQNRANLNKKVKVIEIYGKALENLIIDFKVISRSK